MWKPLTSNTLQVVHWVSASQRQSAFIGHLLWVSGHPSILAHQNFLLKIEDILCHSCYILYSFPLLHGIFQTCFVSSGRFCCTYAHTETHTTKQYRQTVIVRKMSRRWWHTTAPHSLSPQTWKSVWLNPNVHRRNFSLASVLNAKAGIATQKEVGRPRHQITSAWRCGCSNSAPGAPPYSHSFSL